MSRLISVCLLILFSWQAVPVFAQDAGTREVLDSLLLSLDDVEKDSNYIKTSIGVSDEYYYLNQNDSALQYAEHSLKISKEIKWKPGICLSYYQVGLVYGERMKDCDKAKVYFDSALNGYRKLRDSLGVVECYSGMGMVYDINYKYSEALTSYFKSLTLVRKLNNKEIELSNLMNIGNVYGMIGEKDKSLDYYNQALVINEELGLEYDEALLMVNMAVEYAGAEEYDKALEYNNKAIKLLEKIEEDFVVAHTVENNGEIYREQGKYNKAVKSMTEAGVVFRKYDDKEYIANNLLKIGSVYLAVATDSTGFKGDTQYFSAGKAGNLETAILYLDSSKAMYDKGEVNDIMSLSYLYELTASANEEAGNIEQAYNAYKEYKALEDSIIAQEDDKKIAQLEGQRAIDLKDKELELQNLLISKRRNERGFLLGGIAFLMIVSAVVFRNYRERGKANKLLAVEKHKSEELLLNILPEEVAAELKEKGSADAMHFESVTILFTDFVNFTHAGERMTTQELVDELHACFKAFDEIVENHGIEKIKTIGDAYLAACGLPIEDGQHARKVVQAATEILDFMRKRHAELGDKTFEIRIGIHSGDVVAGIVGVKKFAYDIWGDAVNTAARMEQQSEPGKINISQTTYDLVKDEFNCTYRGELEAKNKGKLKMYFVEA